MAIEAIYCTNNGGDCLQRLKACRMQVEKSRQPTGETHTFEPRPRPAVWREASAVKPVGRRCWSLRLLRCVSARWGEGGAYESESSPRQEGVGRLHNFSVQQMPAKPRKLRRTEIRTLDQASIEEGV